MLNQAWNQHITLRQYERSKILKKQQPKQIKINDKEKTQIHISTEQNQNQIFVGRRRLQEFWSH